MRAVQRAELGDIGAMGSSFTRIGGRPARRVGLAACVSVCLSGCALPPMLEVASLAVGGGSWLFTGKSTADHAISVAVGEDCAMHRPVFGDEFCTPYEVMRRLDDPSDDVMIGDVRLKGLEEITELVTVVSSLAGPSDDAPTIAFDPAPVLNDSSVIALEPTPVDRVANSVANGAGEGADDARDFSAVDLNAMAQAFDDIQTASGRPAHRVLRPTLGATGAARAAAYGRRGPRAVALLIGRAILLRPGCVPRRFDGPAQASMPQDCRPHSPHTEDDAPSDLHQCEPVGRDVISGKQHPISHGAAA